jgi:hypothetical protein
MRIQSPGLKYATGGVPDLSYRLGADFIKAIRAAYHQGALTGSQRRSGDYGSEPRIRTTDERSLRARRVD